ncbi:MAG: hypothetical protein KME16_25505 [Scytolyngbya sp. HA4215-MV1]|jgi:hypothetical protein|nr:hypothetical protein [Scytolyngbya sp. HA4215-MV1]
MVVLEWLVLLGLGGLVFWSIVNLIRTNQQQQRLENAFYRILETQNSCISLIQLAATARVDAPIARQYLDTQAQAFGALPEADAEGNAFYRFPKLQRFESTRGRF